PYMLVTMLIAFKPGRARLAATASSATTASAWISSTSFRVFRSLPIRSATAANLADGKAGVSCSGCQKSELMRMSLGWSRHKAGYGGYQRPCRGRLRIVDHLSCRAGLDQPSSLHDCYSVGDGAQHGEIMRDEQISH